MEELVTWLYEALSAFVILFAVIDISGSIPLIVGMLDRGQHYESGVAALVSLIFFLVFFFLGKGILAFFNVDFSSFAVAGAIVMAALAIEMIFDITVFKGDAPTGSVTIVPLVFPLIAGPGSITTMLSLKSMYEDGPIIAAIVLNVLVVFIVLRYVRIVQKLLGKGGVYVMRKFFGILLLAISVKLMIDNLTIIIRGATGA